MIRVTAPARLHFGLLHVPLSNDAAGIRAFGGVGLMLDQPAIVLKAEEADEWQFAGPNAERCRVYAERMRQCGFGDECPPLHVTVEHCPREHSGLGVGTQLGLAMAKVIAMAAGHGHRDSRELARAVGRGERSAIGVHGFDRGGLLVEAGKQPGESLSPLVAHAELPAAWRIVLLTPTAAESWHGSRERQAFAVPAESAPDRLCRLVLMGMMPAVITGDLQAFGEAIFEYNRLAGQPFAVAQGGVYSSAEVAACIHAVRQRGVRAVGQSSWGPTVFAIVEHDAAAQALTAEFGGTIARVSRGHTVEVG